MTDLQPSCSVDLEADYYPRWYNTFGFWLIVTATSAGMAACVWLWIVKP